MNRIPRQRKKIAHRRYLGRYITLLRTNLIRILVIGCASGVGRWLVYDLCNVDRWPLSCSICNGTWQWTDKHSIQQALQDIMPFGTFFTQPVAPIRNRLEQLPGVSQVKVRKEWPDRLLIEVIEYQPRAIWNGQQLIDVTGKVFTAPLGNILSQQLPQLYGPDSCVEEVICGWRKMVHILESSALQLTQVKMDRRHAWQLVLNDHIHLQLGCKEQCERLRRFVSLYTQLPRWHTWHYFDLRYPYGMALRM